MNYSSPNGDVRAWIPEDSESIHLRALTEAGDPVELTSEEARELAAQLLELANLAE